MTATTEIIRHTPIEITAFTNTSDNLIPTLAKIAAGKVEKSEGDMECEYKGFTHTQLRAAFGMIENKHDWKASIHVRIQNEKKVIDLVVAAIEFYFADSHIAVLPTADYNKVCIYSYGYAAY